VTKNMMIWDAGFVQAMSKILANGDLDLKKTETFS
jgi:hypothetical protein